MRSSARSAAPSLEAMCSTRTLLSVSSRQLAPPPPPALLRRFSFLVTRPPFDSAGPVPPPPTAAYSSDYSAAAPASAGLGWRVFGRIWQDFGTEQKQPVMDDLLYPDQAVDGVVHAEGMSRLKAALQAQPAPT